MITIAQRCKIAAWTEVLQSVTAVQLRFLALYRPHYAPDQCTILDTFRMFMNTGYVMDGLYSGRPRSGQIEENVAAVRRAFDLTLGKSI